MKAPPGLYWGVDGCLILKQEIACSVPAGGEERAAA